MAYAHVANVKLDLESPLDALMEGEEAIENTGNIK